MTSFSGAACSPDLAGVFTDAGGAAGSSAGAAGTAGTATTSSVGGGGTAGTAGTGGSAGTSPTGGAAGDTTNPTTGGSAGTGGTGPCMSGGPNADQDADGYTPAQGDCNDCDPAVNPNAVELAGNQTDDNCDGKKDEAAETCDEPLAIDEPLPALVAHALDLCKASAGEKDWGITGGVWVLPDGSAAPAGGQEATNFHLGHGVLSDFGPNVQPRAGKKLLALSSGVARRPNDPGYMNNDENFSKGYQSVAAPGFPKETAACNGVTSGSPSDATALAVGVHVPSNVHGFSFDFSFYARDFPDFVCSSYNDVFFTILAPQAAGAMDGNVAYDEMGSPVTLSGADFRACSCNGGPCMGGGKNYPCPLGAAQLMGTGFESHGATGWLTTTVPVDPGSSIVIRWGVYDTGDGQFDSTVLVDNWQWIATPGVTLGTKIAQ